MPILRSEKKISQSASNLDKQSEEEDAACGNGAIVADLALDHQTPLSSNVQMSSLMGRINQLVDSVASIQAENRREIKALRAEIGLQTSTSHAKPAEMQMQAEYNSLPANSSSFAAKNANSKNLQLQPCNEDIDNNAIGAKNCSQPNIDNLPADLSDNFRTASQQQQINRFRQLEEVSIKLYPLPQFNGKPEEWPAFYANYCDSTAEFAYSNRQNLMRLQKSLQGAARQCVSSLLIFPEDVDTAIDELKFNYGRPELLIRSLLESISQIPQITENKLEGVFQLSNRVRNMVALLKSAKSEHHINNPTLLEQLVSKLPTSKQYEWASYVINAAVYPNLEDFSDWISHIARVTSLLPTSAAKLSDAKPRSQPPNNQQNKRFLHAVTTDDKQQKQKASCVVCKQQHHVSECKQFKTLNCNERWEIVKKQRFCFACLQKGHNIASCQSKKECATDGCKKMHHDLLHSQINANEQPSTEHICNVQQHRGQQLFKVIPVTLSGPAGSVMGYAMLDDGSSVSLLEADVAKKLGLKGQDAPLTLQWYNRKTTNEKSKRVSLEIKGQQNGAESYAIKNVRTVQDLDLPVQSFCRENYEHLKSLPITNYVNVKPCILIGLDNCVLGVAAETLELGPESPVAAFTKLGWVAYGPVNGKYASTARIFHVSEETKYSGLHQLVHDYFSIENFGVRNSDVVLDTEENKRARRILEESTKFIGDRYETGLLWRQDNIHFPDSYDTAKKRLLTVERKMERDSAYATSYTAEIDKYISKGYAKSMPLKSPCARGPRTWYLPHFGVVNPNKPNKLRVVFDAAATTSNVSLNSKLLKGPEHAQPLIDILHRFRLGKYAVAGDIQEMFCQVRIKAEDQDAQRFLWRDGDINGPIKEYAMQSMIFGATCSPCCAEHIKNINAEKFSHCMPAGAKAIIGSSYVDDLVVSFNDENEALKVVSEAITINAAAGFYLRIFVSNSSAVESGLNKVPADPNHQGKVNLECQSGAEKILGLFWNKVKDTLEFEFKFHKVPADILSSQRVPTKREMLSVIMSIFDPLGLLANHTITAKLLMQCAWKRQLDWNDELPSDIAELWNGWWNSFQQVKSFSVPRCLSTILPNANNTQLHVFVDASTRAYAAVAYLRVSQGELVEVSLVSAKTRCAPMRSITIPRMELQAALLGSRLSQALIQGLQININSVYFWSDSKTVIHWIRSPTAEYKQFVACRIAEILSSTSPQQWRWLPTTENISDDATRAKLSKTFVLKPQWINGPDFLRQDASAWPDDILCNHPIDDDAEKLPKRLLHVAEDECLLTYTKFSSFLRLTGTTAWVLRFVTRCKSSVAIRKHKEKKGLSALPKMTVCAINKLPPLSVKELKQAERFIIRCVQHESFADDIRSLKDEKRLPKSSNIYSLTPYLDEDNLLHVGGRINNAICLSYEARSPLILPRRHYVSHLIMRHYHTKRHHQNDLMVINEMRQKFWALNARALLKEVKRNCNQCIIAKAKPTVPLMGQLPSDRLTPYVRPFTYTGVDYCGPFLVAIGRRREKRWVALFTCLSTRAVHLEVSTDLSTDAFIVCLRNFINRRGSPVRIRSDNGTNFVGTKRELAKNGHLFDFNEIGGFLARNEIEWIYNCPANPSAGGCWERLVQCVKKLLVRTLHEEAPRLETFISVLIEAENIINSRPLTDIPVETDQEEPLTPNHFLNGCLNSTQTPHPEASRVCLRKQWLIAQNLKDRIWKRWVLEYLPQLLCRPKWLETAEPLSPGQLVMILDHKLPRSQWQRGKIIKVFKADDGQVRTAEVLTSQGVLRRPVMKLAALKLSESSPQ